MKWHFTFEREAKWMLWLTLGPFVLGIFFAIVIPFVRRILAW